MSTFCISLGTEASFSQVGAKAFNLTRLILTGIPVPPGFTISRNAFRKKELVRDAWIETLALCDDLGGLERGVFVRSSAVEEDRPDRSMAGNFLTVPGVITRECLREAIHRCWLSMERFGPAIIVQQEVQAKAAGVAFTADPMGTVDGYVVEANLGYGESVVSGLVTPDRYEYDRKSGRWSCVVARKSSKAVCHNGQWKVEAMPSVLAKERVLDDSQLVYLSRMLSTIEGIFGRPQDVEWCLDYRGEFQFVQSRPITTLAP